MSASLGFAAILPTADMNMDWYYHKADQGLYKAKQSGKNRIGNFFSNKKMVMGERG